MKASPIPTAAPIRVPGFEECCAWPSKKPLYAMAIVQRTRRKPKYIGDPLFVGKNSSRWRCFEAGVRPANITTGGMVCRERLWRSLAQGLTSIPRGNLGKMSNPHRGLENNRNPRHPPSLYIRETAGYVPCYAVTFLLRIVTD